MNIHEKYMKIVSYPSILTLLKIIFGIYTKMVQKGHCTNSFTAAMAVCRRRKRRENCRALTCFSPWSIISCWFKLVKSKDGKTVDGLQSHDENPNNEIVLGCLQGKSSSSAQEVSGAGFLPLNNICILIYFLISF